MKCLTCINDQIPESAFCGKKFTNHDSYKTEADIYFHVAYDRGNRTWEYYFGQDMPPFSMQGIDQPDLFLIDGDESCVKIQDTSEDCHRHSGNDNGGRSSTEPYNEQGSEGRFRQAVQNDQIRFQYLGYIITAPEGL